MDSQKPIEKERKRYEERNKETQRGRLIKKLRTREIEKHSNRIRNLNRDEQRKRGIRRDRDQV